MKSPQSLNLENTATLSLLEIHYIKNQLQLDANAIFYKNNILQHTIYRLKNNICISKGKKIGNGFWGNVHIGMKYNLNDPTKPPEKCIIKSPKKKNSVLGKFLNHITHLNKRMENECLLVRSIFGEGDALHVKINNRDKTIIVIPFLGEISLAVLLKNKSLLHDISVSEWLRLFITLCEKLNSMHIKTNQLHRDIKPDNIGLTLQTNEHGLCFQAINYLDYGNSHPKYEKGFWGNPKYSPLESNLGIFLHKINDERIDIFALGRTLQKVTHSLIHNDQLKSERETFRECEKIFKSMSSLYPPHRPNLNECICNLKLICQPIQKLDLALQ